MKFFRHKQRYCNMRNGKNLFRVYYHDVSLWWWRHGHCNNLTK